MTDQITVPRETWDALREAVEGLQKRLVTKCEEQLVSFSFVDVDILNAAAEALTAANAASHANPETAPPPEGGAITSEPAANAVSHPQATEPAWRPIETAPKDGTVIDLWHEEFGRYPDCYWGLPVHTCGEMSSLCDSDVHSMDEGWVDTFNEIQFPANQYTHWMPLPAAPEAK